VQWSILLLRACPSRFAFLDQNPTILRFGRCCNPRRTSIPCPEGLPLLFLGPFRLHIGGYAPPETPLNVLSTCLWMGNEFRILSHNDPTPPTCVSTLETRAKLFSRLVRTRPRLLLKQPPPLRFSRQRAVPWPASPFQSLLHLNTRYTKRPQPIKCPPQKTQTPEFP